MKLLDSGDCEINAMNLATEHTTVPVPSILQVMYSEKCVPGQQFIIIHYIRGRNLEECWVTLTGCIEGFSRAESV